MKKGECLGYFMMGSTVIILTESSINVEVFANTSVKFSDIIAKN